MGVSPGVFFQLVGKHGCFTWCFSSLNLPIFVHDHSNFLFSLERKEGIFSFFTKNNKFSNFIIFSRKYSFIAIYCKVFYNKKRCRTHSGNRKGGLVLSDILFSFLLSVMADVASYFICKWLDGNNSDN